MNRHLRAVIASLAVWAWLSPDTVHAYLDPSASKTLLQGLLAVMGSVMATSAVYWRATSDLVRRVLARRSSRRDGSDR